MKKPAKAKPRRSKKSRRAAPPRGRAEQIVNWDRTHRFCGRCGTATELQDNERARRCPACGQLAFPRLSPAIITLVTRGERDEEVLLAHGRQFPGRFYSALAGFVEPGESIEEAVRREVAEEAGITVGEVRYLASQPWPFPSSLMIGCIGTALDREITRDGDELEDARWFSRDEVAAMAARSGDADASPRLPTPMSIAYQLTRMWLDGER